MEARAALEVRAGRIAEEAAALLLVSEYDLVVADVVDGDGRIGAAYTAPAAKTITLTSSSVRDLGDNELLALLCHEMAHLRIGPTWPLRHQRVLRTWLPYSLGIIAGLGCGWTRSGPVWERILVGVVCAGAAAFIVAAGVMLFVAWAGRRYELACDIARAHALGTRGLELLAYDPLRGTPWWDIIAGSHPGPEQRERVAIEHAERQSCGCPARRP